VLCIIILVATWSIWLPKGYLVFSDLDFGLDDSIYLDRMFGLFNEQFSSTNFFNLSRLAFTSVPYLLSELFNPYIPHFLLRFIIVICLLLSGLGMFKLLERLFQWHFGNFNNSFHYYALIIPSLFYALNPWVIIRLQHIFLIVGYAFYPLVLYYFLQLFDDKMTFGTNGSDPQSANVETRVARSRKDRNLLREVYLSVALAFCIGMGCAAIHYFFYYSITLSILGMALLVRQLKENRDHKRRILIRFTRKAFISLPIVFLFIAYWIVPYFASSLFLNIEPENVNVADTLSLFSRYSNIQHVLYLVSYWWPMFNPAKTLDPYFWIGGGIFLVLIAYTVFYRYTWHYYVKLFTWTAAISVIIALGVNTSLISSLNVYVVTKIPLIGQIFRDPNKLIGPMALFFSVLIGFGIDKIVFSLKRSGYGKITRILFIGVLLVCLGLYYRPFYLTYTTNYYAGREVPQAYKEVQSQYIPGGKILWTPAMGNMLLSNGLSSYSWNVTDSELKLKTSGDFHIYSSQKPTLSADEGNTGMVSYFHSFLQYLLDWGGAQHLGTLLSWAGFNEVGFHGDVYGQEERQQFNLKVLEAQNDIRLHYDNPPIKLYEMPKTQPDLTAANRMVYATKGLDSIMGLLNYQKELQLNTPDTALFWGSQRLQQLPFKNNDLLVGDSKLDFLLPQLDTRYFYFPFDTINSGNPYTDWAKTLMKTADWSWLLKSNNLSTSDWNYDFGHGIAYTYTPQRLVTPPYKTESLTGRPIVTMKDVINDFFIPGNSNVLKLNYAPQSLTEGAVLSGKVSKGLSGPNIWQTAQSKIIRFGDDPPAFLRMRAVVSGIHAGKMHFKIKFFDEKMNELSVAYMSKDTDDAEFSQAVMSNVTAVPIEAKQMRVDLLTSDDTSQNVYFSIHDFVIEDISAESAPNKLNIAVKHSSHPKGSGNYRVFTRVFRSQAGGSLQLAGDQKTVDLVTKGSDNRFLWMDVGNLHITDDLTLLPRNGLNVVNAVVAIPTEEYDAVINTAQHKISGNQIDIGTVVNNYQIETPISFYQLHNTRTFPGSLMNSLTPITRGTLTKSLDLLQDGNFQFVFTGNIPKNSRFDVALIDSDSRRIPLARTPGEPSPASQPLSGLHNDVRFEENKYFLRLTPDKIPGWDLFRYDFEPIPLKQGKYTVEINVVSSAANLSSVAEAHLLGDDEIHIPESMIDAEQTLLTYFIMNRDRLVAERVASPPNQAEFMNQKTSSLSWFIVGLNPVPVQKGQLLVWKAHVKDSQVNHLHAKIIFTDPAHNLIQSVFAETTETDANSKEISLVVEVPADGFIHPTIFYNGLQNAEGHVALTDSELYVVDDLVKLESAAWLPQDLPQVTPEPASIKGGPSNFEVADARFVLFNEAFNPIWLFKGEGGSKSLAVNLLHNAYPLTSSHQSGSITLLPALRYTYIICLAISISAHLFGLWIWIRYTWLYKKRNRVPTRPMNFPPSKSKTPPV
jgi:hypothetical protein